MSDKSFSRIIGVIGKPYGLDGYVFVRLVTDYPETIKKGYSLYLDENCSDEIKVKDIKQINVRGKKRTVFKFFSFDTFDTAIDIKNKLLYRSKEDAPVLENGDYWIEDLMGCNVYIHDEKYIGKVVDVEKYAFNDNLLVENEGKNIIIIPMLGDYIRSINIEEKEIVLNMLPEYI